MIQSPTPLEVFTKFHDKFCLVIGQGKIVEIAQNEYPFASLNVQYFVEISRSV